MKRLFPAIFLTTLLLLSGCEVKQGIQTPPSTPSPAPESSSPQPETPSEQEVFDLMYLGTQEGCSTKEGYYRLEQDGDSLDNNILYTDYASRREIYLCNKPDCKHDNENCTSYLPVEAFQFNSLFFSGEHLYLLSSGIENPDVPAAEGEALMMEAKPSAPTLYRLNLDGSGRTKLLELPSGLEADGPMIVGGDSIYMMARTSKLKQNDTNSYSYDTESVSLIKIDLSKKTVETICPLPFGKEFCNLIGAYENRIVLMKTVYPQDPNGMGDDAFRAMAAQSSTHIVTIDPTTGEQEEKFSGGSSDITYYACEKEKFYFSGAKETTLHTLDLKTRETSVLTDQLPRAKPGFHEGVHAGRLQLEYYEEKDLNPKIDACYFVDLATGAVSPQNLFTEKPREPVRILAEWGEFYFVLSGYEAQDNYYAAFGVTQTDITKVHYSLISKEDYWNSNPNYLPIQSAE